MKKYCIFALALVLTLSVFTGCGCRKQEPAGMKPTDEMTIAPTTIPTTVPTEHTEKPTHAPTDATTGTMVPDATGGNESGAAGGMGDMGATDSTSSTAVTENGNARARTIR